jgi:pimeloyl-ACP methyl ester carboxylesterase
MLPRIGRLLFIAAGLAAAAAGRQVGVSAAAAVPFEVPYDAGAVSDLAGRLARARYPAPLADVGADDWSYGAPEQAVRALVEHLESGFDWAAQVDKLNEMPQFTMELGEHKVHFVHRRSSNAAAAPLMLVHGWPGSFWECSKILPMLTEPQNYGGRAEDAFHVVCPSIPGFGFSRTPAARGFDQQACAELFSDIMRELGYSRYYLQGGDWGSVVASLMAALPPGEASHRRGHGHGTVLGLHLNMVPTPPPVGRGFIPLVKFAASMLMPWLYYTADERRDILNTPLNALRETGYFHQQSTRPVTTAYGLSDSPVGLVAWIAEKFYQWSDCRGDLFSRFTKDELLTNIMIYWTTNTAGAQSHTVSSYCCLALNRCCCFVYSVFDAILL